MTRTGSEAFDGWVVELAGKAVFADPANADARAVQADALEQLGFQAEGPQWRNIYLTAAQELREGVRPAERINTRGVVASMPPDIFLDLVAVRLNGPKAEHDDLSINVTFTDLTELHSIQVRRGVLHHWPRHLADATVALTLSRAVLIASLSVPGALDASLDAGTVTVDGEVGVIRRLVSLLDHFDPNVNLVEPSSLQE